MFINPYLNYTSKFLGETCMIMCWSTIQYSDRSVYFVPCFRGEPRPSRMSPADRTAAVYVSAWQNTCTYNLHWEAVCCFYRFCHLIRKGCETTREGTQREEGAYRIRQHRMLVQFVQWLGYRWMTRIRIWYLAGGRIFLFFKASRLTMWSVQPPLPKGYQGLFPQG